MKSRTIEFAARAQPGGKVSTLAERHGIAPDGLLTCYRRHSNGVVAAVVQRDDGTLTAHRWPQPGPFVEGLSSMR